jgi:ParB family chromosome partitioning protein
MPSTTKTAFGAERGKSILKFDPEELAIELDQTKPLYQRRGHEPPDPAMVATIRSTGVIEPVVVVRGDDGRPYVAAGARRTIAARAANKELKKEGLPTKLIPAVYRDEKGAEGIGIKIIENALRKDLAISEKAEEARLALAAGYEESQVAEWFGVSESTIHNWREVAHLHPTVQKALDAGTVRLNDAVRQIGKLPKAEQPTALAKVQEAKPTRAAKKASGEKTKRVVTPLARLKRLEDFIDAERAVVPTDVIMLAGWLRGEVEDKHLVGALPRLAGMFENGKPKTLATVFDADARKAVR